MSAWTPEDVEQFERWLAEDPNRDNPRAERVSENFRLWFIEQLRRAALTASDRQGTEE